MPEGAMAKRAKKEKQQNTYQGVIVDVSDISDELVERAKRFVFWYCFPGTDCFQHKKRSAIAAGYASGNAATTGYKLYRNPKVISEIEKLSKSFNSETVDMLYRKYINTLEARAFYDPADFVDGNKFKNLSEIAPEKRVCLDQPIVNSKGDVMAFTFGNRRSAIAEIERLYERHHPDAYSGQDDEESLEMIIERVTIREQERRKNAASYAAMEAEIVERPVCDEECDEEL